MTRTPMISDAFGSILIALRAAYEAEIARLADVYRPRILAGEFSGDEQRDGPVISSGDPRYLRLEREIEKTHPWISGGGRERERLAVVTCSRWLITIDKAATDPKTGARLGTGWDGDFADRFAAECMAHDILAVAAERGWVKRMRYLGDEGLYALKVA